MAEILQAKPVLILLVSVVLYFLVRNFVMTGLAWVLASVPRWSQNHRAYRVAYFQGQHQNEFMASLRSLIVDALLFVGFLQIPAVKFNPPTAIGFLLTYSLLFVFYEFWFYFTHRALHHPKLYFIHKQHHVAKVTSPFSALSFSVLERGIHFIGAFALPAWAASYWGFVCFEGVIAYTFVNFALNLLGHSNIEIYGPQFTNKFLSRIVAGTTFHSMHHARFNGHYGLFTSFLDRFFNTYFQDYPEVQKRAAMGQGLTKISERVVS